MRRLFPLLATLLMMAGSARATDITIGATTQPNFNPSNIGTAVTIPNVTIVSGTNAVLNCSACFRPQWVGMSGFYIGVGTGNYYVKSVVSTSQIILASDCPELTPATVTWHPYVEFRVYADRAFQPLGASYIVQPGTPGSGAWYKRYGASILTVNGVKTLYIPEIVIDATVDAIGPTNQARYTAGFYRPDNSLVQFYACAEQFRVPAVTPTSWTALCQYNSPPAIVPPANEAYTKAQIDARLITCSTGQMIYYAATGNQPSCLTVGSGLIITGSSILTTGGVQQSINVVTDYGCDPADNGGTADQTCFQNAINAAAATGGKTVYAPTGVYDVSGLTIPGGVTVQGDGRWRTIISSGSNAPILNLIEGSGSFAFFGPTIRNLGVRGVQTAGSSQDGIYATDNTYMFNVRVDSVDIRDTGGDGLYIGNVYSSWFSDIYIDLAKDFAVHYNAANMPHNEFTKIYVGNLTSNKAVAYRVRGGEFTCKGCNGVNNVIGGSKWAVVGRKNGVDGDTAGLSAKFTCVDCNLETWVANGVLSYHASTITLKGTGKIQMDDSGAGTGKPIQYDLTGNGVDYFSEFTSRGYIEDGIGFTKLASSYANSQAIHADGFPPIQTIGEGPWIVTAGSNGRVSTFYNSSASAVRYLSRADGLAAKVTVTASATFSEPYGTRYIEANCATACTITIPWAGWYQVSDRLTVKDISGSASTNNITIASTGGGTVSGGTFTISVSGGSVTLAPNGTGDWRVVGEWRASPSVLTLADGSTSSLGIQRSGDIDTGAYLNSSGFYFVKDGVEHARLVPNDNQIKGVLRFGSSGIGVNYLTFPNEDTYVQFNSNTKWVWGATGHIFPGTADTGDIGLLGNELRSVRVATALHLGVNSSKTGELIFRNSSNTNTMTLKAGATAAETTLTLPTGAPAGNDYTLKSSTAGVLSWNAITGTGNSVMATSPTLTSPILNTYTFATLPLTVTAGMIFICTDCKPHSTTNVCESGGNGSLVMGIGSSWVCN